MYISRVNTVAKARLFTAEFSQLSIFTADCLRHPIQMAGVETIWELHTLIVMNSCLNLGMFSEVVCNRFTEDAYLPRVVCTIFGFAR